MRKEDFFESLGIGAHMFHFENFLLTSLSFPRRRESREQARIWIPAFAGMTGKYNAKISNIFV